MRYSDYYKTSCIQNGRGIHSDFVQWIDRIEDIIYGKYCLHLLDIPDEDYMIHFEDGDSPETVVAWIEESLRGYL